VGDWWTRQRGAEAGPDDAAPWHTLSQRDVMEHIRADDSWSFSRGSGVTIAVVDTGTDGSMREFPRRSPHSYGAVHPNVWEDKVGHGTMCAAIACGSDENGGRYNGVAPDATLLSARTDLSATDLYLIYQHLLREFSQGKFDKGLVVSNSYGLYRCAPPDYREGHPYVDLVRACVRAGIVFVFAAGNNHGSAVCAFPETDDHPRIPSGRSIALTKLSQSAPLIGTKGTKEPAANMPTQAEALASGLLGLISPMWSRLHTVRLPGEGGTNAWSGGALVEPARRWQGWLPCSVPGIQT
jgi:Subtilase family